MTGDEIDPPYPSDLEAKGWSLDLDYQRIEQSDTWAIASPEQRPWLLMLWLVSWRQVPAASLPSDRRLIAARILMPIAQFEAWADVLMSGWQLAKDGRMYHRVLTEHVLRMASKRVKDRSRVAAFRAKGSAAVDATPSYTSVCNALPTRDYAVSSTLPTTHYPLPTTHYPPLVVPDTSKRAGVSKATKVKNLSTGASLPAAPTAETWAAYSEAYEIAYSVKPVRNAQVNGQLAQLVARLGAAEAPEVARWFLRHRNGLYVAAMHSVNLLLRDAEKLRTEWATGRQVTRTQAQQQDRTQTNASAFAGMLAEAEQRELLNGKP